MQAIPSAAPSGSEVGIEPDVEVPPPLAQLDPLPLGEGGEGRHAQLGRQRGQVVLGGADPLAAPVDRVPGLGDLGEGAAADAVAGLEHQDVDPGAGQVTGGGQARVAGPDDHHLALAVCSAMARSLPMGHRRTPFGHDRRRSGGCCEHPFCTVRSVVMTFEGLETDTWDTPPGRQPPHRDPA